MDHKLSVPEETQEISLRLDQYDDIFSDFDIRPYGKRALSVDFLDEVKRAARDKSGEGLELILHVPEKNRSASHEATIQERLAAHFKRHHHMVLKEKREIMKTGLIMVGLGIISMIGATFVAFEESGQSLLMSFLLIFLEPAAWFLLWEGMDQLLFNSKNINPELHFYKKMANAQGRIHFRSY